MTGSEAVDDSSVPIDDEARDGVLRTCTHFLGTVGGAMAQVARKHSKPALEAGGVCIQLAGELGASARELVAGEHYYAAAALHRQVIEANQLLKYFQQRPDRAAFWISSGADELRNAIDFRPKSLRIATRDSDANYSNHCAMGGHPRPLARFLLPGSPWRTNGLAVPLDNGRHVRVELRSLLLADSLQHLYETCIVAIESMHALMGDEDDKDPSVGKLVDRIGELVKDLIDWRNADPLARAVPPRRR